MDVVLVSPDAARERISKALGAIDVDISWVGSDAAELGAHSAEVVVVTLDTGDDATVTAEVARARAANRDAAVVLVLPDRSVPGRRLLDTGADGVVWDSQIEATLAATVAAVRAGQLVLPRDSHTAMGRPALSAREKQVLGLVVLGLTNGEIAQKLVLTESTVKSHLASAYRKLDVASRKDAVERILDPHDGFGTGILAITDADRIETPQPRTRRPLS